MPGKIGRGTLTLVLLPVSMSTIACIVEELFLEGGSKNNGATYSGSGTNTWSWEQGKYTCDTPNEMTLTINSANEAVLTSRGGCISLSYVGDPVHFKSGACEQIRPEDKCVVVVYGTYSKDAEQVSFNSCNNPNTGNGGGTANFIHNGNAPTGVSISGEASCTFSNTDEQHHLKFTLP